MKEDVAWLWQATPLVQKQAHATLRTPRYVATSRTPAVLTSLTGRGKPGVLEQAAPGPPMTTLTEQVKVKSWVMIDEGRKWQVREARWTGTSNTGPSNDHIYGTSQGKVLNWGGRREEVAGERGQVNWNKQHWALQWPHLWNKSR